MALLLGLHGAVLATPVLQRVDDYQLAARSDDGRQLLLDGLAGAGLDEQDRAGLPAVLADFFPDLGLAPALKLQWRHAAGLQTLGGMQYAVSREARWSQDGKILALTAGRGGSLAIWYWPAGGAARQLLPTAASHGGLLDLAADGKSLLGWYWSAGMQAPRAFVWRDGQGYRDLPAALRPQWLLADGSIVGMQQGVPVWLEAGGKPRHSPCLLLSPSGNLPQILPSLDRRELLLAQPDGPSRQLCLYQLG